MHELSIVTSIVESVAETAAAYPGARVLEVRLRVGALASVVEDSLQFCWTIVTEDTPLAGSRLVVRTLPIIIHCANCDADAELSGVQNFHCPRCGQIAADFRQGRELEIESIEIDEPDAVQPVSAPPEKVEQSL
jgi:hydrogenase nickel incorporation protein HypA/HybF